MTAKSRCKLLLRGRQQAALPVPLRGDPDRQLLDPLRQPLDSHVAPGEVVPRGAVCAPLSRVAVEDECPSVRGGDRPQAVLAGRDGGAGDHEVGAGLEHGGLVRSGAPHFVPGHHAAEDDAAPHRGPAVADGEHAPATLARTESAGERGPSDRAANDLPRAPKSSVPRTRSTVTCIVLPIPESPRSVPASSTRRRSVPSGPSTIVIESRPTRATSTVQTSVSPGCSTVVV